MDLNYFLIDYKFKMKFTYLFALLAGASATTFQIDPFNVQNFMKPEIMPQFIDSAKIMAAQMARGEDIVSDSTKVQWSQCDDDKGVFTLDGSTDTDPDPLKKGSDVTFNLVGVLSDDITLSNIHIHVDWNHVPLYDEDHKGPQSFSDTLIYNLKWNVPAYAPDGLYSATVTGIDADGSSKDFCITASFTF